MSDYGINIGSRRSRNVITPTFSRDFVTNNTLNHGVGPNITFTRASSATVFTSTGILSTVPNNVPRFDYGDFRTNHIRNSTFAGAVAGNPGTIPTNGWGFQDSNRGIAYIIKSVGIDSELNLPFMEIQLSGANTIPGGTGVNASLAIYPHNSNELPVLSGQTWTTSVYFKTIAGSLSGNPVLLYNIEIGNPNSSSITSFTPTTNWQRVSQTRTMSITSKPRFLRPAFAVASISPSNTIDYTFRIAAPQTELSSVATSFIPTTTTAVTTGVSRGLLIEESRTNFIPTNNVFNWFYNSSNVSVSAGTGIAGLSSYIVSDITESVRESAMVDFLSPLLTATPYTVSCYIRKDFTANNFNPLIRVRDTNDNYFGTSFNEALGTWQVGQSGPNSGLTFITNVSTVDLNTHFRHWFTFSTPTTARPWQMQIFGAHGTTPALTGSIEVAGIQVEQGSFPTSYIPTAGLSATRQKDIAEVTPVTTFVNQNQGTIYAEYSMPIPASTINWGPPRVFSLSDGNDWNEVSFTLTQSNQSALLNYVGNNLDVFLDAGTFLPNVVYDVAAAYQVNNFGLCRNFGSISTDSTASMSNRTFTQLKLGTSGATSHMFNGYIRKITYWPTRLSNNRLRLITS
jgi:hypothetical protein